MNYRAIRFTNLSNLPDVPKFLIGMFMDRCNEAI